MQRLYDITCSRLLTGFLRRDPAVLEWLVQRELQDWSEDAWPFTIPALFELALDYYAATEAEAPAAWRSDYSGFRRLLYAGQTNTFLRAQGGVVDVLQVQPQHAQSVYVLRRLATG